ncbi:hypothetical protein J437_LFUL018811 [Ladona fulva]|uniref:PiggyBac transposable element-derived protein domain-containing protein n=1 Tax=Ladona fulva TaxID=123851 RepID=A0A8K0P7N3_LADFU|nr:hypothetical protein J437_LFUL018811 [Ladona fulva]
MGGLDKSDGIMNMYKIARNKPKKYYHKIFRHVIDMAMLNAYALYEKKNGKLTRKEFIITLGEQLIEKYGQNLEVVKGRPSKSPRPTRITEKHFPDFVPSTTKKSITRRCCKGGARKETRYWCADCGVGLPRPTNDESYNILTICAYQHHCGRPGQNNSHGQQHRPMDLHTT